MRLKKHAPTLSAKTWVLFTVACGTFMATLDSSVVNIALPTLKKIFGGEIHSIKWVVSSYLLVITCTLLPIGKLSDIFGRKNFFQMGYFIFILSSLFCGLANNLAMLIVARSFQGLGASMLMSNGPALITTHYPNKERGKALGILAMVASLGLIAGPSIGGTIVMLLGWRAVFLLNLPIALAGIYFSKKYLKSEENLGAGNRKGFDWIGSILQAICILSFMFFIDVPSALNGGILTHGQLQLTFFIFFILTLFSFIRLQSSVVNPLFNLSLLKNRTYLVGNLSAFLMLASFSAVSLLMPFYLEQVLALSPQKAGLLMTTIPLTVFFIAPLSGRFSDTMGSRKFTLLGSLVLVVSLVIMSGILGGGLQNNTTDVYLVVALVALGVSTGLFQSPNNNAMMGSIHKTQLGVAAAFLATVRNMGLVLGAGLATQIYRIQFSISQDFIVSIHTTFLICSSLALTALLIILFFGEKNNS